MTTAQKMEEIKMVDSGRKNREIDHEHDVNKLTIHAIYKN